MNVELLVVVKKLEFDPIDRSLKSSVLATYSGLQEARSTNSSELKVTLERVSYL